MSKPDSYPAPGSRQGKPDRDKQRRAGGPEPLSGSKKVKNANHVSHLNPEG